MTAPISPETVISQILAEARESPNEQVAPNPPKDDGQDAIEHIRGLQKALYGELFPPAQEGFEALVDLAEQGDIGAEDSINQMYVSWARALWESRASAAAKHLHLVAYNRLLRAGHHWVQSRRGAAWGNIPRPKDSLRLVYNLIDKALDQRLQILTDQRPGFTITPMTGDPEDRRKASARQAACEYQYEQMQMDLKSREAAYWAQTDGVSFWHLFWSPTRGPWDERMTGKRQGDLDVRTLRVEQVRVSPEATATVPPTWAVLRDVISLTEAGRYGVAGVQAAQLDSGHSQMSGEACDSVAEWAMNQANIGEGARLDDTERTDRLTVYLAPHPEVLPNGMQLIIIGDRPVVGPSDLLWDCIPLVRVSDGSSDPSWLCRPNMEQWRDHNLRMNVLLSRWQENIRVNAGGRFIGRPGQYVTETFVGGTTSVLETRGGGTLGDNLVPVPGISIGVDIKEAFAIEKQAFEDASGYNAVSRGQVAGNSGRAIIAAREQLERVFAPSVQAMATAFTDWGKIVLAGMAWGYSMPRAMGATGRGRPDLARTLVKGEDLKAQDGMIDVRVEKGTLMPMPLSYRMYLLDSWLQYGVIDQKEYRRRQTFAVSKDVTTPDEDQEARAKRVCDAIRLRQPVPEMRWQDNEAIHQDVLEREILLQDDLEPDIIAAADERWRALYAQSAQKAGSMQGPQPGGPGTPSGAPSTLGLPPGQQPLATANPPIGAAPLVRLDSLGIQPDEQVAMQEDALTPQ